MHTSYSSYKTEAFEAFRAKTAPMTVETGFLETDDLTEVVGTYLAWESELGGTVEPEFFTVPDGASIADLVLEHLVPLTSIVATRALLVSLGGWVAYWDNKVTGTDPDTFLSVMRDRLSCRALRIMSRVSSPRGLRTTQYGIGFEYQDSDAHRAVTVTRDNSRFVFDAHGPAQDFENQELYSQRRVRDRMTLDELCRTMDVLGIPSLNDYRPVEAVVLSVKSPIPAKTQRFSLSQALERYAGQPR